MSLGNNNNQSSYEPTGFAKGEGSTKQIGYVDSIKYHKAVQKLRNFFIAKGFYEAALQGRLSILAACEDPKTLQKFVYAGKEWSFPQTSQMGLEYELLRNPTVPGFFCTTTSYRNEPNPIPGRHELIFPMFEVEFPQGMDEMAALWKELLLYLGYKNPVEVDYEDMCRKYNVEFIEHAQEEQMYHDIGPCILLKNFPIRTSPFWNMEMYPGGQVAKKIDVLLSGMETIGSASRSCDPETMRNQFYNISDGLYAGKLFELFGRERIEAELNDFLSYDFFTRSGCGIGMTRLIRSLEMEGLLD